MTRVQVGDVFLLPIQGDQFGVGQVIARYRQTELFYMAVYDCVVHGPPESVRISDCSFGEILFLTNTFDAILAAGRWPVIGNMNPPADVPFPAYKVVQSGKVIVEDWSADVRRKARPGEAELLDNRGGVAPIRLQKALQAHHRVIPWDPSFTELTREYVAARAIVV